MRLTKFPIVPVSRDAEADLIRKTKIVFLTVTPVEHEAFFGYLQPIAAYEGIVRLNRDPQTYHIGVFGRYIVAHTLCSMGAHGRDSSQNVVNDVLADINPNAVLMTGIAFGMHRKSKKLGDVLVSESMAPYDVKRIGLEKDEQRGMAIPAGVSLLSRFRANLDWEFRLSPKQVCRTWVGQMLSADKLIDNPEFLSALEKSYPKAIGGEMEGSGLASVCDRKKKEWIVVKGICDWGDGKKNKRFQRRAAGASTDLAHHLLSQERVLESLALEMPAPPVADQLEFQFSAARGTALWALNRLRSDALASFLSDLRAHQTDGLPGDIDAAVRLDLSSVIQAVLDIPSTIQEGKLIVDRLRDFRRRYIAWADVIGSGQDQLQRRADAMLRLEKSREGLGESIRRNSFLLGVALRRGPMRSAIREQRLLVEAYQQWFPKLAGALERIRSRSGDEYL